MAMAEARRLEADALTQAGGRYVVALEIAKMQVAKQFAKKKILIVPGSNVATMDVNKMVDYLVGQARQRTASPPVPVSPREGEAQEAQ